MGSTLLVAFIAALAAICVGYISHFLAEDFRRHRDGAALAAALAGELTAYTPAFEIQRQLFERIVQAIDAGVRKEAVSFRALPGPRPVDRIFDANVSKLGFLGLDMVRQVVFVYGNLAGLRVILELIMQSGTEMTDVELRLRCGAALATLDRVDGAYPGLLAALSARVEARFSPTWPWMWFGRAPAGLR